MRSCTNGIGPAGAAQHRELALDVPVAHVRPQVGEGEDRAGLGHAVAGDHVDALLDGGARERQRQRGAADDHLPSLELPFAQRRAAEHHRQDRRDAVRERHALAGDEPEQHVGQVAAGIHLLHAEHRGDVGKPHA